MGDFGSYGMGGYDAGGGGGGGGGGGAGVDGGGYMNQGSSPSKGGGGGGRGEGAPGQHLIFPMTIRQLQTSATTPTEDGLVVGPLTVSRVEVYGKVTDVKNKETNTLYTVDDGTGVISVVRWNPDQAPAGGGASPDGADVGHDVCVNGVFRVFQGTRQIEAHRVRVVTDPNELAHHQLEVVYANLQASKGPLNDGSQIRAQSQGTTTFGGSGSGSGSGAGIPSGYSSAFNAGPAMGGGGELSGVLKLVHDEFAKDDSDAGFSMATVAGRLHNRGITQQQVRDACTALVESGALYNTIDDVHFKSTGAAM